MTRALSLTLQRRVSYQQLKQFHSSPLSSIHHSSPSQTQKGAKTSSVDDTASGGDAGLRDKILRAPFQRVASSGGGGSALFPWRSDSEPIERLVPGSDEFKEKGFLLGGNVQSSNPSFDALATAIFFLNVPLYKIPVFQHWQDDTAETMAWAFTQGVSGILSNVYQMPFDEISKDGDSLAFENELQDTSNEDKAETSLGSEQLDFMVESKLRSLFQSAHEHGKEQIQVKLECKPTGASRMVNLFVFPSLSRNLLEQQPSIKSRYHEMLEYMVTEPKEALPIYHEFVQDFQRRGWTENTVIAQVLVPCEEIFWVKDLATGTIIQGAQEETPRQVSHLVRMEMVVRTKPANGFFLPFKHSIGNWQITDIDDLLEGNLII